ncbi:MAG TPA: radical SAM protein [Candidatus Lokiarchaeia archaeon]|nr:radical SAM protein [Candidatus Lokiarchaeia archaeon]
MNVRATQLDIRQPDPANLDTPFDGREFRLYIAITNKCNRMCPFCSVYSSPVGKTFINLDEILQHVPESKYQVQFEGGEPFLHPRLVEFARHFASDEHCTRIIISTNGSLFPFVISNDIIDRDSSLVTLSRFFSRLPKHVLLKVSLNHHLLEKDPLLFQKAALLHAFGRSNSIDVVFNLRKRNDPRHDFDASLECLVDAYDLRAATNSFFLQRYGRNSSDVNAELPFVVGCNWCAINPDGTSYGIDLIARSEAMRRLE